MNARNIDVVMVVLVEIAAIEVLVVSTPLEK